MEKAETLYEERQWIPWYWWILAALVVGLISAQLGHNRSLAWYIIPAILLGALVAWWFISLSSTWIRVFQDHQGGRWLQAGKAILPASVVSRSLAVPASAKRNAMGRQLDPAAFVVSHGWIKEMVMLVLDDPEDPTPYWLVGTKNPKALLEYFLPDQAEEAIKHVT